MGVAIALIATGGAAAPAVTVTSEIFSSLAGFFGGAATTSAAAGAAATGATAGAITISTGGLALLVVGAETNKAGCSLAEITLDCWKPILHDDSVSPSQGRRLKDLIDDPRIKQVHLIDDAPLINGVPSLKLVNAWDEEFEVKYSFTHPLSGEAILHATKI